MNSLLYVYVCRFFFVSPQNSSFNDPYFRSLSYVTWTHDPSFLMVWVSDQAPVVQKAYSAIHRINHYPVDSQLVFLIPIHRERFIRCIALSSLWTTRARRAWFCISRTLPNVHLSGLTYIVSKLKTTFHYISSLQEASVSTKMLLNVTYCPLRW